MSRLLLLPLSLGGLAAGVFVIPYLVPQPGALLSVSTLSGYNNSVAYPLYLLFLGLSVYCIAGAAESEPTPPLVPVATSLVPPPLVWSILGVHGLLFWALYAAKQGFVFAEALYFQDLLYRMQAGAIPFVDVHFFYGPAMLYPAYFLSRWMGIGPAYALYYAASYLAGLYLMYVALASLLSSRRATQAWFLFFAFGFFNPYTGLNYAILRHMLPVAALLCAWWAFRAPAPARLAGTVALVTLALCYSPEIGLVTTVSIATLSLLVLLCPRGERVSPTSLLVHLAVPLASVGLLVLLFRLMDPLGRALPAYFQPIVTFSSGGWNTPVEPSLPTLTMMGLTLGTGVMLLRALKSRGWDESTVWLLAYGVLILLMERAAFGKADVSHIAYSGLPLYLLAVRCAPVLLRGQGGTRWLAMLMVVGVVLPLQLFHGMMFLPYLKPGIVSAQQAGAGHVAPGGRSPKEAIQASLVRAIEHFGRDRPYYMHKLEYYRLPVYLRFGLEPLLYFPSLTSVFTEADMRRVIQDLRERRAIVLARRADLTPAVSEDNPSTHWLLFLTSSPLPGSSVFELTNRFQAGLEAPLLVFLQTEYEVAFEDGEIVALLPRRQERLRPVAVAARSPAARRSVSHLVWTGGRHLGAVASKPLINLALQEIVWVTDSACAMLGASKGGPERCATSNSIKRCWGSKPPGPWSTWN